MSITAACLRLYATYAEKPTRRPAESPLSSEALREVEETVRPTLDELERLRQSTIRTIDRRVIWMVPGGVLTGAVLSLFVFENGSVVSLFDYTLIGGALGAAIAFSSPNNAYRRAFKSRIIPYLAGRIGDLTYRPAEEPDLKRLVALGILPPFRKKCVEDEIYGTYRDVRLNIVEARLETGGKQSTTVFNGLLVEIALPGLSAAILVAKDAGLLGNAIEALGEGEGLEHVRLEDPRFESYYQVYSDDQIAARALLTPAVMERLMAFERVAGRPPRLIVEGGVLSIAVTTPAGENFFEPPSIADPVRGGDQLLRLSGDIGSVLKLIDAVLDIAPQARAAPIAPLGKAAT